MFRPKVFIVGLCCSGIHNLTGSFYKQGWHTHGCHMSLFKKIKKRGEGLDELFDVAREFDCLHDYPWNIYWPQLAEEFPDAKFICSFRHDQYYWFRKVSTYSRDVPYHRLVHEHWWGKEWLCDVDEMHAISVHEDHRREVFDVLGDRVLNWSIDDHDKEESLSWFLGTPFKVYNWSPEERRDMIWKQVEHEKKNGLPRTKMQVDFDW